jgi:hypothetical protein
VQRLHRMQLRSRQALPSARGPRADLMTLVLRRRQDASMQVAMLAFADGHEEPCRYMQPPAPRHRWAPVLLRGTHLGLSAMARRVPRNPTFSSLWTRTTKKVATIHGAASTRTSLNSDAAKQRERRIQPLQRIQLGVHPRNAVAWSDRPNLKVRFVGVAQVAKACSARRVVGFRPALGQRDLFLR